MAHEIDVQVGERIRTFRLAKGKTQADLAEAIGVKFQQVQKYETGSNRVSASKLFLAAKFLECQISDFFDPMEENFGREDVIMAARFANLSDRDKRCINHLMAAMQVSEAKALAA